MDSYMYSLNLMNHYYYYWNCFWSDGMQVQYSNTSLGYIHMNHFFLVRNYQCYSFLDAACYFKQLQLIQVIPGYAGAQFTHGGPHLARGAPHLLNRAPKCGPPPGRGPRGRGLPLIHGPSPILRRPTIIVGHCGAP